MNTATKNGQLPKKLAVQFVICTKWVILHHLSFLILVHSLL